MRHRRGLVVLASIAASAAIVAGAATLRLPPDITYDRAPDSPGPVVFSHVNHVALAPSTEGACTGCHPEPFKMLQPARRMRHEEMNKGKQCGMCHDGKSASGVEDDCGHCHTTKAGGAP